jgi:hypothetical protein
MGGYMATSAKQKVLAPVEKLPADATIEDAMERLYFLTKIDRGVADADAGRLTDHEEVRLRFSRSYLAWKRCVQDVCPMVSRGN